MRVVNVMNFVRQCDPRLEDSERILYETAAAEEALVQEFGLDHTVLLQYDALIDPEYQKLFAGDDNGRRELGLWYEIVKPLTDKAGLPWRGREGYTWDWFVVPGFSMAYNQEERKRLITVAMEDFKAIFGFYPKTVASWLLDSFTVSYLEEQYHVSAIAICRDQINTDAYTLVGGYFNQGYYPSRKNVFCPAQTAAEQVNVPVFRLLGPDPIHNYDMSKYITDEKYKAYVTCYTLEPIWPAGADPDVVKWFFDNYFRNEDLGFSYAQIGQENSFGPNLLPGLRMQLELLKQYPEVKAMKMCDTGEWFRKNYPQETPATAVSALNDWNGSEEVQSVYYDCKNYTANIFKFKDRVSLRSLYLFDEDFKEAYLDKACETWDATYENLPVVDTLLWNENAGLILDETGSSFSIEKEADGCLKVSWGNKEVIFTEDGITIRTEETISLDSTGNLAGMHCEGNQILYCYKGISYAMKAVMGSIAMQDACFRVTPRNGLIKLQFR